MVSKPGDAFDLTGQKFDQWTVVDNALDDPRQGRYFKCICTCGEFSTVRGIDLKKGNSTRCKPCARIKDSTIHEVLGKKFGKWTVIDIAGKQHNSYSYLCRCECGNEKVLHGPAVRYGCTTQCHVCSNRQKANNNKTHGHAHEPLYKVWSSLKSRCQNPNAQSYQWYGAKGVTVCDRWQKFEYFLEDMAPRPEGMTIDRIDVDGPYCKENCQWITQSKNSAKMTSDRKKLNRPRNKPVSGWWSKDKESKINFKNLLSQQNKNNP